jgi:hypothetical protein
MRRAVLAVALGIATVATLGAAIAARPRADAPAVDQFIADARRGTTHYGNQQAAIDDGFTRVGAEFPAMGEHWVSFARIMEDSFEAERPSVLIYVGTDSGPRLAGVAYTRLLRGDARAPDFPRASAWHEHNGAVDEESLPLHHGANALSAVDDSTAPRLAILHAWIWNENPRGMFETDNWSLPLARFGIRAAPDAPRDAIRALALAEDRDDYLLLILRTALDLTAAEDSVAAGTIAARRTRIAPVAAEIRASRSLDAGHQRALNDEWSALWADLDRALVNHQKSLRSLRARM